MDAELTEHDRVAGVAAIRAAPTSAGPIDLLVARPDEGRRRLVEQADFEPGRGLVGDRWAQGDPNPEAELTLIGSRAIALIAGNDHRRWAEAGDQIYVDLDLSEANLPTGSQLELGDSILFEVTALPHLGCGKFVARFGVEAMKLVNSPVGRQLRLRGLHVRVLRGGSARVGEEIRKL